MGDLEKKQGKKNGEKAKLPHTAGPGLGTEVAAAVPEAGAAARGVAAQEAGAQEAGAAQEAGVETPKL